MTKVKDSIDDSITASTHLNGEKFVCQKLEINSLLELKDDINHVQMTEVPRGYFKTIKNRKGKQLDFFDNLLQVTVVSHGMIFDLDTMKEVEAIENID